MGQQYEQLSLEERCTLSRLSQAGKTIRQIAAAMDRAPSTIMRELKRNSGAQGGLSAGLRRAAGEEPSLAGQSIAARCRTLQAEVLKRLGQGWSPAQVCGGLKKEQRRRVIS